MIATREDQSCIYCLKAATNVRDGEHVIPQAIGGALTITERSGRLVCNPCNNGILSQLDTELCSRSYLAFIAAQEIKASLWQVWDVDHLAGGQLIEAKPSWTDGELDNMICHPQMVFEPNGPSLLGDARQIALFGQENFESVLVKAVYRAFQRYCAGEKRKSLFFERVDSAGLLSQGYRYDPRAYTPHSIQELAKKIDKATIVVRYKSASDKSHALRCMSNLGPWRFLKRWGQKPNSRLPAIASHFNVNLTLRGLIKLGVNILAGFCEATPVSYKAFTGTMRLILGQNQPTRALMEQTGFVLAEDMSEIKPPVGHHAFRLTHTGGEWVFYASFFGGRIGAKAFFTGPNHENWNTIDIVAPIGSKKWECRTSRLTQLLKARANWHDLQSVAPSVKILNSYAQLSAELVDLPKKR